MQELLIVCFFGIIRVQSLCVKPLGSRLKDLGFRVYGFQGSEAMGQKG